MKNKIEKGWFSLTYDNEAAELTILDEIGGWGISVDEFIEDFNAVRNRSTITLRLNSPGGSVFDGLAIYNTLKTVTEKLDVEVLGIAASMASIIALAGRSLTIGEGALLMIHNPWTVTWGDAEAIRKDADLLDKIKQQMIDIYFSAIVRNDGEMSREEISAMMDAETWLSAAEAVELGLATTSLNDDRMVASADFESLEKRGISIPEKIRAGLSGQNTQKEVPMDQKDKVAGKDQSEPVVSVKPEEIAALNARIEAQDAQIAELKAQPAGRQLGITIEDKEAKMGITPEFKDYIISGGIKKPQGALTTSGDGVPIPTDLEKTVVAKLAETSLVRKLGASVSTYKGDGVVTTKTVIGDAEIIAEGGNYPRNDDTLVPVTLHPYKMGNIYAATEEADEDSFIDLMAEFEDSAVRALAGAENTYFLIGTGSSQPQGVFPGATVAKTAASTSAITYDDLVELDESLDEAYQERSCYVMHPTTAAVIRKLKDSNGQPIWGKMADGRMDTLFGRPVYRTTKAPTIAASARVILLGDFRYYKIGDRRGLRVKPQTNPDNGDMELRYNRRTDGEVLLADAFQVLAMAAS